MSPQKILLPLLICFSSLCYAQLPVKWIFNENPLNPKESEIQITAILSPGWHLYSQHMEEGGPFPTRIHFEKSADYAINGTVNEKSKPIRFYDSTFMIEVVWFTGSALFTQKINNLALNATIKGTIEYMVCNNEACLPPAKKEFQVNIK